MRSAEALVVAGSCADWVQSCIAPELPVLGTSYPKLSDLSNGFEWDLIGISWDFIGMSWDFTRIL